MFFGAMTGDAVLLEKTGNELWVQFNRFGRSFRTQSANTQYPQNYRDSTIRKNYFGNELDD